MATFCDTTIAFATMVRFNGNTLNHIPKKTDLDVGGFIGADGVIDASGRYHSVIEPMGAELTCSLVNDSTYSRASLEGCGDLEVYYSTGKSYLITDAVMSESPKVKDGDTMVEVKFKGSIAVER